MNAATLRNGHTAFLRPVHATEGIGAEWFWKFNNAASTASDTTVASALSLEYAAGLRAAGRGDALAAERILGLGFRGLGFRV